MAAMCALLASCAADDIHKLVSIRGCDGNTAAEAAAAGGHWIAAWLLVTRFEEEEENEEEEVGPAHDDTQCPAQPRSRLLDEAVARGRRTEKLLADTRQSQAEAAAAAAAAERASTDGPRVIHVDDNVQERTGGDDGGGVTTEDGALLMDKLMALESQLLSGKLVSSERMRVIRKEMELGARAQIKQMMQQRHKGKIAITLARKGTLTTKLAVLEKETALFKQMFRARDVT